MAYSSSAQRVAARVLAVLCVLAITLMALTQWDKTKSAVAQILGAKQEPEVEALGLARQEVGGIFTEFGGKYSFNALAKAKSIFIQDVNMGERKDPVMFNAIRQRIMKLGATLTTPELADVRVQIITGKMNPQPAIFGRPKEKINAIVGLGICVNPFITIHGTTHHRCDDRYRYIEFLLPEGQACADLVDNFYELLSGPDAPSIEGKAFEKSTKIDNFCSFASFKL